MARLPFNAAPSGLYESTAPFRRAAPDAIICRPYGANAKSLPQKQEAEGFMKQKI